MTAVAERYGSEKLALAEPSQNCNGAPVWMTPDKLDFYRRMETAAVAMRDVHRTCSKCGCGFVWQRRGFARAQAASVCPGCKSAGQKAYAAAWRQRQRVAKAISMSGRTCEHCCQPMPEGRADRRHCSSACRQAAYRRRSGDGA